MYIDEFCTGTYNVPVVGMMSFTDEARALKKLRTSKGDYWIKQLFSSIAPLFKWELLLKEKMPPKGANSFL